MASYSITFSNKNAINKIRQLGLTLTNVGSNWCIATGSASAAMLLEKLPEVVSWQQLRPIIGPMPVDYYSGPAIVLE